jgi:hypothetical protein
VGDARRAWDAGMTRRGMGADERSAGADAARTTFAARGGVTVRRCCISLLCATELRDGAAEIVIPFLPFATGRVSTCTVRESRFAFSEAYPCCNRFRASSNRALSPIVQTQGSSIISTYSSFRMQQP